MRVRAGLVERAQNVLLGLSVLSWGVMGIVDRPAELRWSPVYLSLSLLNLCVGLLFLLRSPERLRATWGQMAICTPGVVLGALTLRLAPSPPTWAWAWLLLFVLGTLITLGSFLSLGRSFAVFPALRRVVSTGPYRLVRHPAYAGELLMVSSSAAAGLQQGMLWPGAAAVLALGAVILRIEVEERTLRRSPAYRDYAEQVPHRLVPGVW